MSSIRLTDRQWAFIRPYLPAPARTGRPRADDRRTIEGILYVLITGCRWQDLPREYGAPTTAWRRLTRWDEEGVWDVWDVWGVWDVWDVWEGWGVWDVWEVCEVWGVWAHNW